MDSQEIISAYEAVLDITSQMLEAARTDRWEDLAALEESRFNQLEKLRAYDRNDLSDDQLNSKKAELIQAILAGDAETKTLTEAWMVELRKILDSLGAEKKLNATYAPTDGWR